MKRILSLLGVILLASAASAGLPGGGIRTAFNPFGGGRADKFAALVKTIREATGDANAQIVTYVGSFDSLAYINTQYTCSSTNGIEVQWSSIISLVQDHYVAGCPSPGRMYPPGQYSSVVTNAGWQYGWGAKGTGVGQGPNFPNWGTIVPQDNALYVSTLNLLDQKTVALNGLENAMPTSIAKYVFESTNPIRLFYSWSIWTGRIYMAKISQGGTISSVYVPIYANSAAKFFDMKTGVVLVAAQGTLTAGPVVTSKDQLTTAQRNAWGL